MITDFSFASITSWVVSEANNLALIILIIGMIIAFAQRSFMTALITLGGAIFMWGVIGPGRPIVTLINSLWNSMFG